MTGATSCDNVREIDFFLNIKSLQEHSDKDSWNWKERRYKHLQCQRMKADTGQVSSNDQAKLLI